MKQPPSSMDSEQAVITSMLLDNSVIAKVEFLKVADFYFKIHQDYYEMILDHFKKEGVVDLNLIANKVTEEMGGYAYLADIMRNNATTINAVAYAKQVLELSVKRGTIENYATAIDELYDPQCDYIAEIAKSSDEVNKSLSRLSTGDVMTVDQLIEHSMDEMERSTSEIRMGISTGLPEIDERLGYQMLAIGEVTYLGAQSKNGKTLFGNTIMARCDLHDDECGHVFSIEMPAVGMFNGIVSAMSGVPNNFYARQATIDTQHVSMSGSLNGAQRRKS